MLAVSRDRKETKASHNDLLYIAQYHKSDRGAFQSVQHTTLTILVWHFYGKISNYGCGLSEHILSTTPEKELVFGTHIHAMRGVEATTRQLLIAARQVCSTVQGIHLSQTKHTHKFQYKCQQQQLDS